MLLATVAWRDYSLYSKIYTQFKSTSYPDVHCIFSTYCYCCDLFESVVDGLDWVVVVCIDCDWMDTALYASDCYGSLTHWTTKETGVRTSHGLCLTVYCIESVAQFNILKTHI